MFHFLKSSASPFWLLGARSSAKMRFQQRAFFHRNYATYKSFDNKSKSLFSIHDILYNRRFQYFMGGCIGFYLYNLDEAPFTHRYRFLWVPYWMEKKIGDYSYSLIISQYRGQIVPSSDPLYRQIRSIMNRLLASAIDNTSDPKQAAHLKSLQWSINIIQVRDARKEPPNAFILPNGKIFIFSSIFPICKNEDGLATVLSHELSHQLAHHSSEQLSKQPFYIALSTMLYAATGISWFNDLLIAGLLQMPSSREMESEADRIGCELMARSCFNVREAVNFWNRMESWEKLSAAMPRGGMLQEFLSTHPNTAKRVHDIQQWMPELEHLKETSNCYQWGRFDDFQRNYYGERRSF